MREFTLFIRMILTLFSSGVIIWLIAQCKSLYTGFISTCLGIIVCYAISRYASYIAEVIVWVVRFAVVIGIVAFILGIYPKRCDSQ